MALASSISHSTPFSAHRLRSTLLESAAPGGDAMKNEVPELQDLAQRVERLERENRRLKRAGLVALALAAVLVLTGRARSSRVMEANRFVLRDTSGRVRAELKTEEDLSPRLVLLDSHGASRAWLDLSKKGEPTLRFWDAMGKP